MISLESIAEKYKNLDDNSILELAHGAKGLRKEVVPILKAEVEKRNLGNELLNWIDLETFRFEPEELVTLMDQISLEKCTLCNKNHDIAGYRFNTIVSGGILLNRTEAYRIICKQCASKERMSTMLTTFFLGWWSRQGILSTPLTLIGDFFKVFKKKSENKLVMLHFIENHTAMIRKIKAGELQASELLIHYNNIPNTIL
jgi:hypothetical protein